MYQWSGAFDNTSGEKLHEPMNDEILTFIEKEIEAAKQEGYDDGFQKGYETASGDRHYE